MSELLKTLCDLEGVSSREDAIREFIRAQAQPIADSMREDEMGNLIVFKKGKKSTGEMLMLAAHMDEVGLMIRAVTEEGYLKFFPVGGIDRRVLIGKKVLVGEGKIPGIIGLKPYHLVSKDEEKKVPKLTEFYIDIGAETKDEAAALVKPGDVAIFAVSSGNFGTGYFKAKAIDDRIGCAVLLKLLTMPLLMDCTFVFTVQEEVGTRGAFGASFSVNPEIALVLEGTTAADIPSLKGQKRVCVPGEGPVIPFMDGRTVYDRGFFELLRDLAQSEGIPWQTKHLIAGGTDAATIQGSRGGVRVAGISAAVRYLHTPTGLVSLSDYDAMCRLAYLFIEAVAAQAKEVTHG